MRTTILWTALGTAAYAIALVGVARGADEETAPYSVIETDGKFEIRDYPKLVVASTSSKSGDEREADQRFMKLFRYISGGNEGEQKIAMTTPVFMRESGDEETMSFVMPSAVSKAGAPAPSAAGVVVESIAAQRYAVYRFSGLRSAKSEAAAMKNLSDWMEVKKLLPDGNATFAYYNPPWIPGFLRRNEILVPLSAPPSE